MSLLSVMSRRAVLALEFNRQMLLTFIYALRSKLILDEQ